MQEIDEDRWLIELKNIDPNQYEIERSRIAEQEAQQKAEQQAKASEQRARECGEKNETLAYVMSQDYVKRMLKAPSTAKFPIGTGYSSRAVGDCKYKISAFVDSQNGFGAMLRTKYTAEMLHFPESNSWVPIEVNVSD